MDIQQIFTDISDLQMKIPERARGLIDRVEDEIDTFEYWKEIADIANNIKEGMYRKIAEQEIHIEDSYSFDDAVNIAKQLDGIVKQIRSDYKEALDNMLEHEIAPRLEVILQTYKAAMKEYVQEEEGADYSEVIENFKYYERQFRIRECSFLDHNGILAKLQDRDITSEAIKGQSLTDEYLIPLKQHVYKNTAAIKYHMLMVMNEISCNAYEWLRKMLYESLSQFIGELTQRLFEEAKWLSRLGMNDLDISKYCTTCRYFDRCKTDNE